MFPQWVSRDRIMEPSRSEKTLKIIRSWWMTLAETSDTYLTTLCKPQVPQTGTSTNSPDTRNVDVCENSNLIYGITRGMCLENKRVSPQAFWLWCLELQKQRYSTLPQTLDKQSLVSVGNSCKVWPRDSKPLSCYLVAKGAVFRTLTSLCTKYRGILICCFNLHP